MFIYGLRHLLERLEPRGAERPPAHDGDVAALLGRARRCAGSRGTRAIPADGRKKLIYGVPYYGREWATVSDEVAAATTGLDQAITYADAKAITGGGVARRWLDDVATPWFARQKNGGWRQAYYDDEESLAVKYDLANDQDCGGVGMWALNMDVGHDALWTCSRRRWARRRRRRRDPARAAADRRRALPRRARHEGRARALLRLLRVQGDRAGVRARVGVRD